MNRVLVTGGAGFIGSHLVEKLLKQKSIKRVICIDNLDPFYSVAFKKENLKLFSRNKKFVFYKEDIRNKAPLERIFKKEKPDYVVHLAARADTRKSVKEPDIYEEVNVRGTLNMLELSKNVNVKRFVFISSSSVYGNSVKPPFLESDTTDFPLAPYGATKKAGEVLAYTYFHNFKMPIVCLRVFNAYGERVRPDLVLYKWVENILNGKPIELSGAGKRKRDFTYVGDIVGGIMLALKSKIGYEIINLGNSNPVSLTELLSIVEKVIGKKAVVKKRESHKASVELTCANIKKAKRKLGWQPKVSLEKGISNFVVWFKKNRL